MKIQATKSANKKIAIRKRPSQPRSQKMLERILEATRNLIMRTDGLKLSKITTNHIAKEAGISVGSLYQYFPNKEAIVLELYKEMLATVRPVLEKFKTEPYLSLPRVEFFDRFNRAMKRAEADTRYVMQMHHAMHNDPLLEEMDRQHAALIAGELANFMKHFGSTWPMKKLQRLALHVYYVDYGTWIYREHIKPPAKETLEREVGILNFMIAECFQSL